MHKSGVRNASPQIIRADALYQVVYRFTIYLLYDMINDMWPEIECYLFT